jgi:diguanylate cyclase (GGDEF)-like protein
MVELRLLGPVEVVAGGETIAVGVPQRRVVLAALAVDAGRVVTRARLIDRVWDNPSDRADATIYVHITRLRRVLDEANARDERETPARLERKTGGYVLAVDPDEVDVHRFRRLVAEAEDQPPDRRVHLLEEALDLWRGPALAGLAGSWVHSVRDGWQQERLEATLSWARAKIQLGNPAVVLGRLTDLMTEHPAADSLVAVLMQALAAAGRPTDALEQYTRHRRRLADLLGVDPAPEVQAVHQAILRSPRATAPSPTARALVDGVPNSRLGASGEPPTAIRRPLFHDPPVRTATMLALGWLAAGVLLALFADPMATTVRVIGETLYLGPILAATFLAYAASRTSTGRPRWFWRLLALSNLIWLTGETIYAATYYVTGHKPFPGPTDALFLTGHSLVIPAILVGFGHAFRRGRSLVDTTVVALGVGLVGWRFLIEPQAHDRGLLATLIAIAYPLISLAIVTCLLTCCVLGFRLVPRAVLIAVAAFAVTAIADAAYTDYVLIRGTTDFRLLDVGWLAESLLLCLAAFAAIRGGEIAGKVEPLSRDVAVVPAAVCTVAAGGTVALDQLRMGRLAGGELVVVAFMVAGLLVRQLFTTGERTRFARYLQAELTKQRRLAATDALTGLYNRWVFEDMLNRELANPERTVAVVALDLDHFGKINEVYGRAAGDRALAQIADRLRHAVRPSDLVARFAGEEFVCLLPDTDADMAAEIAERLRATVSCNPLAVIDGQQVSVTVSAGLAVAIGETGNGVLANAGRALHQAKETGRDRTFIIETPVHDVASGRNRTRQTR